MQQGQGRATRKVRPPLHGSSFTLASTCRQQAPTKGASAWIFPAGLLPHIQPRRLQLNIITESPILTIQEKRKEQRTYFGRRGGNCVNIVRTSFCNIKQLVQEWSERKNETGDVLLWKHPLVSRLTSTSFPSFVGTMMKKPHLMKSRITSNHKAAMNTSQARVRGGSRTHDKPSLSPTPATRTKLGKCELGAGSRSATPPLGFLKVPRILGTRSTEIHFLRV